METASKADHGIIFTLVSGGVFLLPCLPVLAFCLVSPLLILFVLFYALCPVISGICFRKGGELMRHFAWSLILSFSALSLFFWLQAFEIAASDAQGGLVFIFGPMMVGICSLCTAVLYLLIVLIVRFFRRIIHHA